MNRFCPRILSACFVLILFMAPVANGQDMIEHPLTDLDGFQAPADNWRIVGAVEADRFGAADIQTTDGDGILLNMPSDGARENLFTMWEHGDIELSFEFMMPKGSNSGVYLQGRYEIQLFDSWGVPNPTYSDAGGIYQRWDPERNEGERGYQGHPPSMNVSRAPGLWQDFYILFQAPRFDAEGRKVSNAKMVKVAQNGVVIHENVELTGPTRAAGFSDEQALAPIMIQGDHGPVALRNIRYNLHLPTAAEDEKPPRFVPAIHVEPTSEAEVIRGFVNHDGAKKTRTISVGDPDGVHYVMDSAQGAVLYAWKGRFIETTDMWHSRGTQQLAVPRGSVLTFSGRPAVARLESDSMVWPDSMGADYVFKGYDLDADSRPSFHYTMSDVTITDRLLPGDNGRQLEREIVVSGDDSGSSEIWVRVAAATTISEGDDGVFRMEGNTYYLELLDSGGGEAIIRALDEGEELLVPVSLSDGSATVRYALIW